VNTHLDALVGLQAVRIVYQSASRLQVSELSNKKVLSNKMLKGLAAILSVTKYITMVDSILVTLSCSDKV